MGTFSSAPISTPSSPGSPLGVAGETWKLKVFDDYDKSGNKELEPYRVLAHRLLNKTTAISAITAAERQLGKSADLACGFGGGLGAWRRIAKDEGIRSDDEVKAIIHAWRVKHPKTCAFWERLVRAARSTISTGKPVQVSAMPRLVTNFDGYALTITLPNNRIINYPSARLVPSERFVNGAYDIEFMDNAQGQWKPVRAWYGVLVENVVQGIARDLLAGAIMRAAARGWDVVHHAHDELVIEAPIGAIPAQDVLTLLLEKPTWATNLPLGGKVRNGPLFFEGPGTAEPPAAPSVADHNRQADRHQHDAEHEHEADHQEVEHEADLEEADADELDENTQYDDVCLTCLSEMSVETGSHVELAGELPDDPSRAQRESPISALGSGAEPKLTPWEGHSVFENSSPQAPPSTPASSNGRGNSDGFMADADDYRGEKINCPFHDDRTPSCHLYPDGHYHCFGCKAHGSIEELELDDDVLARLENRAERETEDDARKFKLALKLWDEGKPIAGTLAARYFSDTRKLDLSALPTGIDAVLRFHPRCAFGGNGAHRPCLLALFRDVGNDAPAGIHRIGLTADAKKIKRLSLGRWPKPRAIKLWPVTNKLSIGEGIETVLGAIRCGAITPPAWALGSRTNIAEFPVVPGIKALTILVDNDGGQARPDAEACAARYIAAGCRVRLLTTKRVKDFNDVVMA
jgi:Toprim domain/CHC2 zinc finger